METLPQEIRHIIWKQAQYDKFHETRHKICKFLEFPKFLKNVNGFYHYQTPKIDWGVSLHQIHLHQIQMKMNENPQCTYQWDNGNFEIIRDREWNVCYVTYDGGYNFYY